MQSARSAIDCRNEAGIHRNVIVCTYADFVSNYDGYMAITLIARYATSMGIGAQQPVRPPNDEQVRDVRRRHKRRRRTAITKAYRSKYFRG